MHPEKEFSKGAIYQTPNLEKLAQEGIRFSAAYAPSPVCASSRISLMTGQNCARLQWTKAGPTIQDSLGYALTPATNRRSIKDDEITIGELLRDNGYTTAHFGKWHLQNGGPEKHGFDVSDGNIANEASSHFSGDNPVDIYGMSSRAANFMKASKESNKPFFVQMSWLALHSPENASEASKAAIRKASPSLSDRQLSTAAITRDLDLGVGKLLATLEALNLSDNTYVIYMADNGGSGAGGKRQRGRNSQISNLKGSKGSLWEGGIRSPLIIRGPGIKANTWCHHRVVGYDLFPTFVELSHSDLPDKRTIDGTSFAKLLTESKAPFKRSDPLVFHFPHYQSTTPCSAIYDGEYKLLHFYETGENALYHISSDLMERNDLSTSKPKLAEEMSTSLKGMLKSMGASFPKPNPQAIAGKTFDPRETRGPKTKGRGGRERRR